MIKLEELKDLADWELHEVTDACWDIIHEREREKKDNCIKKFEKAFYELKENNIDLLVCDDYVRFDDFTFE